ncbi:fructoselysine 6-kinase [Actinoallomurus rhizosphaericola]|uniref:fructoselysine 6-kinase n=1 Tax=Actinoallomurus rhizosphaericola TaxID=2952536 RepID=UPI002093515A|nr:fructoselysine 6-kinase [Actinoallomurus rhizosphaericola]MCO5997896.1 fructoselysine 6-kinase [Actinoallomurus rhizosphaericola]
MDAAVIGDVCIDRYDDAGHACVTGNAVDTGVHLAQLGVRTALISAVGDDADGAWARTALAAEGLDLSRLRTVPGATAVTHMRIENGERIHGEYEEGVLRDLVFDADDVAFAGRRTLVHSALWGRATGVLHRIRALGAIVSFDYADRLDSPVVAETAGSVDIGFFSAATDGPEIREYLAARVAAGMRVAIATFGRNGSLAYDGTEFTTCPATPATVVNTVGAGDSFIAGFLAAHLRGAAVPAALAAGSCRAAGVVSRFDPWQPASSGTD